MIKIIYIIIISYFILGAAGFYFINKRKQKHEARQNRIKFITYFFIIHLLFLSIVFYQPAFRIISGVIVLAGGMEMVHLFRRSGYRKQTFFILSLVLFGILSWGFITFGAMDSGLILFVFLILSIFDSFCQISGQLWGKTPMFPSISPNKTIEGLAGGAAVALMSAVLLRKLIPALWYSAVLIAAGVVVFALVGDLLASLYKRRYNVKDFSNLIPGHGGFLDRFDSLIAGGAWVAFLTLVD